MESNTISAEMEKQSATNDDMANVSNDSCPSRFGISLLLLLPDILLDVAKETPAMSDAITVQDSAVFLSHSLPLRTSSLWLSMKFSPEISPLLLSLKIRLVGTISLSHTAFSN
ncbi:uncharacterized protein DS421_2g40250 [Arachis hypogaea]|nr:uncharacterized protein DS421_2g40250 [Arachis hypogaea]